MTVTIWEILWWIISTIGGIISAVAVAVWWFRGQTKQAEIAGLKTANGALKEQFKSHEIAKAGEIAALKTSIETLREQIKTIEAAKAGEIAALREQIKAHEAWRGLAQDQTKQTAERLSIADATIMTLRGQLPSGAPKEALMAAATAVHSAIASNTIVAKSLDPEFQSTPPAERLSKLEQSKKDTTDVLKKTGELDLEALIDQMIGKNVIVSKGEELNLDEDLATKLSKLGGVDIYKELYDEPFSRVGDKVSKLPKLDRDALFMIGLGDVGLNKKP
jgi:hypothetical protein